jgi:lysophospholipase L1-like esterase
MSNLPEQPLKIVALGDSLVYGYGDRQGGGWVERLRRQWLTEADHVIYNLGIRGDQVQQVSERLEREFACRGELKNRYPDLIILSVGINDSARLGRADGKLFTEFELFKSQIAQLLEQAQKLAPVFFVGMVPVDETKMPFLDCLYYNHFDQFRYKEASKQACLQRGIPYLDIFDHWMLRGEAWVHSHLSADGLHPNGQGHQAIYQDVNNWEALNYLLPPQELRILPLP